MYIDLEHLNTIKIYMQLITKNIWQFNKSIQKNSFKKSRYAKKI